MAGRIKIHVSDINITNVFIHLHHSQTPLLPAAGGKLLSSTKRCELRVVFNSVPSATKLLYALPKATL